MFVGMTLVRLIGMVLSMFNLTIADGFLRSSLLGPSVLFGTEWNTSITKSQRVRAGIPSMRKPASKERTSDSVELCEAEVCFLHIQLVGTNVWLPKIHRIPPEVDFETSKSQQSLSIEIIPIYNAVLYFPHGNAVCHHSCYECNKSSEPSVCHKLSSILWQLVPVCLQTKECQVYQYVTNTSIWENFESILMAILQQIPILLRYIDGHQGMELRLCKAAELFC